MPWTRPAAGNVRRHRPLDAILWAMGITRRPRTAAASVLAACAFILSACGESDEAQTAETPSASSESPATTPPTQSASASQSPSVTPTETPKPVEKKTKEPTKADENTPAVKCARRKGNPGEIFVWNSYGGDQPADAMRLGAGFVWSFGEKECITTTEFALRTVADLPGYCTEVGKVAANPGYRVNARPAERIPNIVGQRGDC